MKDRASYLHKCNKQFAEGNVIKLLANKRTNTSAYKTKSSTNGTEIFSVFTTSRNEAILRDCIKCLEQAESGSMVKIFQKEGGIHFLFKPIIQKFRSSKKL